MLVNEEKLKGIILIICNIIFTPIAIYLYSKSQKNKKPDKAEFVFQLTGVFIFLIITLISIINL